MCLIIQCKKELPLNEALVEHWLEKNGDGWGMMWLENNTIQTFKSMAPEQLWDKYNELKAFDPFIHLRWRTHGDTDLDNCHPYYCGHGIFLMHNGVIGDASNRQKEKSDTWHFIEDWVKGVFEFSKNPHETMRSPIFKKLLEKAIGTTNRIVLGDRGGFVLFNKDQWHTIRNENTGVSGLLVSNGYAWDSWNYGKPPVQRPTFEQFRGSSRTGVNYGYGYGYHDEDYPPAPATYTVTNSYDPPKEPIPHIDGSIRNSLGMKMTHALANIYLSEGREVWVFNKGKFIRCEGLDKSIRKRLAKEAKKIAQLVPPQQESLILLPRPPTQDVASPPILVNVPDDTDEVAERVVEMNQDEYREILVKTWRNESSAAIHTKVYSEPDDAAIVLCSLLGK